MTKNEFKELEIIQNNFDIYYNINKRERELKKKRAELLFIKQNLEELSPLQREVLILSLYENKNAKEISILMGRPIKWVAHTKEIINIRLHILYNRNK